MVLLVAGCGDNAPAPEPCNGIDDNGDGQIDEGCPCEAYSNELPTVLDPMLVSLGAGWATIARSGASASYVRLDDRGHLLAATAIPDLGSTGRLRALAWDGNRLSYLGGLGDTYLAHLTVDGQADGRGPSLDLPDNVGRVIAVTASGYHAAITRPINNPPTFVALDRAGQIQTTINGTGAPGSAIDIVERADGPVLAWTSSASVAGDDWNVGPLLHGVRVTLATAGSGNIATDGTTVLMAVGGHVFAWDGATVTQVSGVTGALAVAWTGRTWQVVTGDETYAVIHVVSLDTSLSVTDSEQVFAIPPTSGTSSYVASAAVAGDARRLAVSLQSYVAGVGHQQLIQLCR